MREFGEREMKERVMKETVEIAKGGARVKFKEAVKES